MNDNIKTYIKVSALAQTSINIANNIPILKLPKLSELGDNLFSYLYFFGKYINEYEEKGENLWFDITETEQSVCEFIMLLNYFIDCTNLKYENSSYKFENDTYINFENFNIFMDALIVLHHRDKDKKKQFKPANDLARQWMEEAERRKKEVKKKQEEIRNKQGNKDSGFNDILSTISARHPSLNLLNIYDLNYYQLIDQYKRLLLIDKYTPCLHGNATEEYIKNNKVEHYGSRFKNE